MKIAVVGCSHGELDTIYNRAQMMENERGIKIDLLICCGDFQSTRNKADQICMAVPEKYSNIGTFYKYYSGERQAPMLTIFIGGNHEASNYLQELPYGGWVAPNIYYVGYAGVVNFGGLRIGGLSGIYKPGDYLKGHFEKAPYNKSTMRSVYHVRNLEVFRLKQLSNSLDIMMSHDWPREVYNYGSIDDLLKHKPFFEKEVSENTLGSKPAAELLFHLKPKQWFAAHLHTRFCAIIPHINQDGVTELETSFMALSKCLPRQRWIEIIDVPHTEDTLELSYDLEWLTILYLTDYLMSPKSTSQFMPGPSSTERWNFIPTEEEKEFVRQKMGDDLRVPLNFVSTAPFHDPYDPRKLRDVTPPRAVKNPQTVVLCERLSIRDPLAGSTDDSTNYDTTPTSSPRVFSTPGKFSHNDSTFVSFNSSGTSENTSFRSDRLSLGSNFVASSPLTFPVQPKKPKLSFPPIEQSRNESDDLELFSFQIDRNASGHDGSPETKETIPDESPKINKEFKRRNASIYASQDE